MTFIQDNRLSPGPVDNDLKILNQESENFKFTYNFLSEVPVKRPNKYYHKLFGSGICPFLIALASVTYSPWIPNRSITSGEALLQFIVVFIPFFYYGNISVGTEIQRHLLEPRLRSYLKNENLSAEEFDSKLHDIKEFIPEKGIDLALAIANVHQRVKKNEHLSAALLNIKFAQKTDLGQCLPQEIWNIIINYSKQIV
jgi:hypothetical protein